MKVEFDALKIANKWLASDPVIISSWNDGFTDALAEEVVRLTNLLASMEKEFKNERGAGGGRREE